MFSAVWASKRSFGLWLVFGTLSMLAGCQGTQPVVKIALVAPFEGRYRDVGYDAIYAARLAVREVNARQDLKGYRVALVALDDGGQTDLTRDVAQSLVLDEDVVAVVGHAHPETTAVAVPIYARGELPLIPLGEEPFGPAPVETLPVGFRDAYARLTPFDEIAGPYSGPAYDAMYLVLEALKIAESTGEIDRASVATALRELEYQGVTGRVFQP